MLILIKKRYLVNSSALWRWLFPCMRIWGEDLMNQSLPALIFVVAVEISSCALHWED